MESPVFSFYHNFYVLDSVQEMSNGGNHSSNARRTVFSHNFPKIEKRIFKNYLINT